MTQNLRAHTARFERQTQTLKHCRPDVSIYKHNIDRFQDGLVAFLPPAACPTLSKPDRLSRIARSRIAAAYSGARFLRRQNTRGQVIHNADTLKQGQKLHITLTDGETDVRVTKEQAQGELFD